MGPYGRISAALSREYVDWQQNCRVHPYFCNHYFVDELKFSSQREPFTNSQCILQRLNGSMQTLFADNTYPKTYLVTWLNTLSFSIFLVFTPRHGSTADRADAQLPSSVSASIPQEAPTADDTSVTSDAGCRFKERKVLNRPGIARSALDFCMLWFSANLFVAIALKYSTVASCTILTSTSGFWTLVLGAFWNVEKFSSKKLLAVILSICGIVLVSSVDIGREKSAGIFPHKSILEVLLGDMMSLASALLYAVYTLLLKTRSSRAGGSGMLVYLGFVGVFAGVLLWPGLVLLNGIGLESLQMPPTRRVCVIVLVGSPALQNSLRTGRLMAVA